MVIIDKDVTMDNQQPSPLEFTLKDAVHRLRWQWVIGVLTHSDCLRYSRADSTPLRKRIRLEIQFMQIIHRSVGEPAEGSLTRIHVSTNRAFVFNLSLLWNMGVADSRV
jgi:hypothetical protein